MTALLVLAVLATLLGGTVLAALMDRAALPLAALLTRQRVETEAPDRMNRDLSSAWYLALAAIGLSVVPFAPGLALIDSPVGIVIWGSCEALVVVTVFLHGWSPNAPFPLIGAYRYAAIGLPIMLPSMFVLIAAALPAESLSLIDIVESQREIWNVLRQPLGLPLFLVVALAMTLRGPMDYADAADIATGTSAEESGAARALWQVARLAMLVSISAIAATVFLGGPLGPVLPGPVWLWLKTAALMALTVWIGNRVARTTPDRMLTILWVVLLPLSFLGLIIAGVMAL
ncbi:complex I subunit 1 family protein [Palleronia abyssalis]|uniref:NADH-quinone oxidoreductase subunit H n=1 Tax=Palleronia abyssalis TaxID=1501240 RepID=A0A2R8C0B6_9RHOB|nr:complex I subunit 1 family protein [Palleronia abyssalis]SPJ25855.1 NADH-quinone oxidoreductase subunit H [Palleronia abyssalis]